MNDTATMQGDYMPLANSRTMLSHKNILDSLRLDLKIAADGCSELAAMSAEDICRRLQGSRDSKRGRSMRPVYEAAAAVYCHELYFCHIVTGDRFPSLPEGDIAENLKKGFGSVGNFFYLVRTHAGSSYSPGFLWLYEKRGSLGLLRLPLYTLPNLHIIRPLMCIDLWEHAYIDGFGQDISGYADAYLRQTDWNSVITRFSE